MPSPMTNNNGPSIKWEGSHSALTFSQVIKKVADQQKSGDLQVFFGEAIKTVYFKEGEIVFAASNIKDDRLGENMMTSGCISEREFLLATNLMQTEGRRFGEALVRMGLITREELERQLYNQFHRIILSLFPVREGIYSFEEHATPIPEKLMVHLSIPNLLLDGFRNLDDEDILLACLPSPSFRLHSCSDAFSQLNVHALQPEEKAVLNAARQGVSLQSILQRVDGDCHQVLRACSALFSAGFLDPEPQTDSIDLERTIRSEYHRTETLTETELLDVPVEVNASELEKAYHIRRLQWAHVNRLIENESSLQLRASEIQFRLAAAYHTLLMKKKRGVPAAEPKPPTRAGHPSARSDDLTPTRSLRKAKAGKLLRGVKFHFSIEDWEGAIPLLEKLVKLEPRNPHYRGLLAKAMFKHPRLRSGAERHFLEAIRLSPRKPDLRVWLGIYYKSMGMEDRAKRQFHTALKLDPEHPRARQLLANGRSRNRPPSQ